MLGATSPATSHIAAVTVRHVTKCMILNLNWSTHKTQFRGKDSVLWLLLTEEGWWGS